MKVFSCDRCHYTEWCEEDESIGCLALKLPPNGCGMRRVSEGYLVIGHDEKIPDYACEACGLLYDELSEGNYEIRNASGDPRDGGPIFTICPDCGHTVEHGWAGHAGPIGALGYPDGYLRVWADVHMPDPNLQIVCESFHLQALLEMTPPGYLEIDDGDYICQTCRRVMTERNPDYGEGVCFDCWA